MKVKDKLKESLKDQELEDRLDYIECRINELECRFNPIEEDFEFAVRIPTELYEEFVKYTDEEIDFIGIT